YLNGVAVVAGATISLADASKLTFTPNADWNGDTSFTYHAVDDDGLADATPATITITVNDINDAPETNDLSVSGDEDASSILVPTLSGSDSDGNVASFVIDT
ncbi:cadherin-like domain-containing protein, partial [Vibrio coralliirubri]|uniref:cadherin-like domain-containing protein n=1 Tax=Vibrio coralliirubri TaxID=1516159 RepID=UPI000A62F0E9